MSKLGEHIAELTRHGSCGCAACKAADGAELELHNLQRALGAECDLLTAIVNELTNSASLPAWRAKLETQALQSIAKLRGLVK